MARTRTRGIFLSYRREDTRHMAGRLAERLASRFGEERVFMDVDSLEPGIDFADAIDTELSRCDVMIVLIGTAWSKDVHGDGQHRFFDPQDFIALEVGTALTRRIRVIPVLVEGAHLPSKEELPEALQPLLRRHAVRLDHDSFNAQAGLLIESVRSALEHAAQPDRGRSPRALLAASIVAPVLLLGAVAAVWAVNRGDDRVCPDRKELSRQDVMNPLDGNRIALAVLMQAQTCEVWLRVQTDGADRRVTLALSHGDKTVSHEETGTLVETDKVRVPTGTPLVGRVEIYSVNGQTSWSARVRASS